jgi:serine/threonine protein kinase/tetratricopeptide (TPR) repeat protein
MRPLDPDRWRTLSPYLDSALEVEPDQRPSWLAALASTEPQIAADLRALLGGQDAMRDSGFLEGVVQVSLREPPLSLSGQVLGAYRLLSLIGQGGMGSVWLAERCDGRFEGRAAVKLLNIAVMGRAGEERFRREGNILARMTHPNIARLSDAGVSAAGQPYLVLEFVDGQPMDRYCDERVLDVESRLRLFLDVLDAVAHAHANLIVHRDIKPGNVLVSVDGHVKLLDFGIAKLLDDDGPHDGTRSTAAEPLTKDAWVATPQYAAPEQVARGVVTTATDVYALGVLMYVLLTGVHPAGTAASSPATLMHAIVEVPPRRPSDAVEQPDLPEALAAHAIGCNTTPTRLGRMLRGDLDTIISKALKKNPAERYASVTALAEDIRRFLQHEPIAARPDTLAYRATTFVRRHARGVAASAAVVALLAALIGYHIVRLETERDRAQREAAKARKASDVLTGLLMTVDPYDGQGSRTDPTFRGVLDAGTEQVRKELDGQPELQAGMLTVLGRIYRRLGVFDRAQPLLEQALASGNAAFDGEHVEVAQTLHDLGVVLADKGDYAAAAQRLEQSLAMRRRLLGNEHADTAITLSELGRVYQDLGSNQRAEPLQREALRIRQKVLGEGDRETAVSQSDLASVLRLNGDVSGAEALLKECLETNRRTNGEIHPNTSATLHDLALIAEARGDAVGAEATFRQALDISRKTLGDSHPVNARTLNSLSHVLAAQGRTDEAATALREALAIARPALGPDHQLVAIYMINLAAIELARNEAAVAETLIREALPIRTRAPGLVPSRRRTIADDDWSVATTKALLGASLVAQQRFADAEVVLLDAHRELDAQPARSPRDVKSIEAGLVRLYDTWGRRDAAAPYRARLAS